MPPTKDTVTMIGGDVAEGLALVLSSTHGQWGESQSVSNKSRGRGAFKSN